MKTACLHDASELPDHLRSRIQNFEETSLVVPLAERKNRQQKILARQGKDLKSVRPQRRLTSVFDLG